MRIDTMSYTKRFWEETREKENHYNKLHEEDKNTLDADYRYDEFMKEQYPQHIKPETKTTNS